MNQPVRFEIAKLLKEKGYWGSFLLYSIDGQKLWTSYLLGQHEYEQNYPAPTITEVVMWLHEKRGVWISVKKDYHNGAFLGFESVIDNEEGFIRCGTFDSPEEAYEAAIKYALKNLMP